MHTAITLVSGGLLLFLYAISQLSQTLQDALTERMRALMSRYAGNVFSALLAGLVATILLGSSSAVIIIAIVLMNARALVFVQGVGIVLGANIGTTLTSQLIALDIGKYAIVPLALGLLMQFFVKNGVSKALWRSVAYFGMLFFGLFLIETAMEPFKDNKSLTSWLLGLDSPLRGAAAGGLLTLVIQSSSATVGLAITLAKQGMIQLKGGIAVMLGAELGTCSDTLLATIRGSRHAIKTGLFHLLFNLTTIMLGLLMFSPFVAFVQWISGDAAVIDKQVANAHLLFNVLGVLLALPFVNLIRRGFDRLMPDRQVAPEQTEARQNPARAAENEVS